MPNDKQFSQTNGLNSLDLHTFNVTHITLIFQKCACEHNNILLSIKQNNDN